MAHTPTSTPPPPSPPQWQTNILAHASVRNRESELKSLMVMVAIVSIFSISVIITAIYYAYLRRYYNSHRGSSRSRPFSRRAADIFFSTSATEGLHNDIVNALPVFLYKPENFSDGLSCSVCLFEFEENEKGKLLPICNHSFHVDCIDMWLFSHSTCPLCRANVEKQCDPPVELGERQMEVLIGEEADDSPNGSGEEHGVSSFNGVHLEEHSRSTVVIDIK